MAFAGSLLALLILGAACVPLGIFLPPLILLFFLLPFWGLPWLFGTVHAFRAAGRGNEAARRSRPLWLLPLVLIGLATATAFTPLPRKIAFRLAQPALEKLLAEAEAMQPGEVRMSNRWLGLWPIEKAARYASGEVRVEILGGRLMQETRGLFFDSSGPPLPGTWQPDRTLDLGNGWYGWARR